MIEIKCPKCKSTQLIDQINYELTEEDKYIRCSICGVLSKKEEFEEV